MPSTVRLSIGEGVAVVTLADPCRRNAFSKQLSDELAAAAREAIDGGRPRAQQRRPRTRDRGRIGRRGRLERGTRRRIRPEPVPQRLSHQTKAPSHRG
jgi:hypothetical protein